MLASLRQLFRAREQAPAPAVPAGRRVYAVGDVHGRLDLFEALIAAIEADDAARAPATTTPNATTIVLLGDLVDRGPDSAGVVAAARALGERREVCIIAGNHEEMMLESFASIDTMRQWLRHGGRETVLSYGMDRDVYATATFEEVQATMHALIGQETRDFLAGFDDSVTIGDYHFVHAGVRPGVALGDQAGSDLRWIREPFLSHGDSHGAVIVHGHTITEETQVRANRIGIDTGGYSHGRLTALGLEGTQRWLIAADDGGVAGAIDISTTRLEQERA